MSNKPLISIGIPIFNGTNFFLHTYEYLKNQTFQDFEIILSNNCSTDETALLINRLQKKDSKIRVFHQTTPVKPVENFKKVLELSQGEYFMWLSHDDFIEKNYLLKLKPFLNIKDAVFGKVQYVDDHNQQLDKTQNHHVFYFKGAHFFKKMKFLFYPSLSGKMILFWSIFHSHVLKKRLASLKNYPGDQNYFDMPFVYDALQSFNFIGVPEAIFYKRNHSGSESIKQTIKSNNISKTIRHLLTIKSYFIFLNNLSFPNKVFCILLSPIGYLYHMIGNIFLYVFDKKK